MKIIEWLKSNRLLFWVFSFFYVIIAFHTFRDYGVTIDEPKWYDSGKFLYNHYRQGIGITWTDVREIFSREQSSYSYIYSTFLRILMQTDVTAANIERVHLLNMLFGLLGFWAAYELLFFAYENSFLAILGPLFLYLTFRFSGDIPANPKDMPFAVFYLVTLVFIFIFRTKWKSLTVEVLVLGTLIGITSCLRLIGLSLLLVWVVYRFFEYWAEKGTRDPSLKISDWFHQDLIAGILIFLISQFWMSVFWPYLGSNYFGNWPNLIENTLKYPIWDNHEPFMGRLILGHDFPRYYVLIWLFITIPVFLILFFLVSFFIKKNGKLQKLYFLLLFNLLLQLLLFAIFKPLVYNGIRHYLFLEPIFCLIGTIGLIEFFRGRCSLWGKGISLGLILVNIILVLVQLDQLYPYQYIYFNELIGGVKGAAGNFDLDYWGASMKEAVQWLAANEDNDLNKTYKIAICGAPFQEASYLKSNMVPTADLKTADYYILMVDDYEVFLKPEMKKEIIEKITVHTVQREGIPLVYVLKMKKTVRFKQNSIVPDIDPKLEGNFSLTLPR